MPEQIRNCLAISYLSSPRFEISFPTKYSNQIDNHFPYQDYHSKKPTAQIRIHSSQIQTNPNQGHFRRKLFPPIRYTLLGFMSSFLDFAIDFIDPALHKTSQSGPYTESAEAAEGGVPTSTDLSVQTDNPAVKRASLRRLEVRITWSGRGLC